MKRLIRAIVAFAVLAALLVAYSVASRVIGVVIEAALGEEVKSVAGNIVALAAVVLLAWLVSAEKGEKASAPAPNYKAIAERAINCLTVVGAHEQSAMKKYAQKHANELEQEMKGAD